MRRLFIVALLLTFICGAKAQQFNDIPAAWKWVGKTEVMFSYDATFADTSAFSVNAVNGKRTYGVSAPAKFCDFPVKPEGAVNLTYSPDSTMLAYTKDNDLYVVRISDGRQMRLTYDGSDVILNGYASWVYYEEIFGRPSRYRAFWWSPDSRKIGFYRFDNTHVPMFPIYSAYDRTEVQSQSPKVTDMGPGGSLSQTRYPKAGQTNPQVRIGIADLDCETSSGCEIVWADFDSSEDQYFGIPFWSPDSKEFFIARMPRLQNTIDLYAVNVCDGSARHVYNESYKTWLNWFDGVRFTDKGLYMVREFETGWQQIYFLSYDGRVFRRLTDGPNWDVSIVLVDEEKGNVFFTAKRDGVAKHALYRVDRKGIIKPLTDPEYNVTGVVFSPDGKYFVASISNTKTPVRVGVFSVAEALKTEGRTCMIVSDMKGPDYDPSEYALGELVQITTDDGFTLPGMIVYPKNFDPSEKYPVHVDIYGGPDTPMVRDRWVMPSQANQWYSDNGIIQITVDPRAAGHNGRAGLDMIYRQLTVWEVKDFCAWADWLASLEYVQADKIGVEGFSFGGTMTCMLLMQAPDRFHFGIAGGGVYDWALYDSHYTERYMDTPQNNPEGYRVARVLEYVDGYPASYKGDSIDVAGGNVMLKLTHGTGDDNVHHQNTLLLVDQMHRKGKKFELMIYPDGMHGYRGYQGEHFLNANHDFWKKYLKTVE